MSSLHLSQTPRPFLCRLVSQDGLAQSLESSRAQLQQPVGAVEIVDGDGVLGDSAFHLRGHLRVG